MVLLAWNVGVLLSDKGFQGVDGSPFTTVNFLAFCHVHNLSVVFKINSILRSVG